MKPVQTTWGALSGLPREGHVAYYGIPYGASTGGTGRWKAPLPAASWSGVRMATEPGLASPQSSHPIPGFAASGLQGEDCLCLNVFTPTAVSGRRPVLFWIHGGGFTHGSGSEDLYNGGPLAVRGDVVVVTINYRLGALGYLYLGAHIPGEGLTANAGQLDQILALRWVQENIEAFGGDPANVTIFGESAGAAAVGTLLAMPAARALFHKAILQSGTGRSSDIEAAERIAAMVLQQLGIERSDARRILEIDSSRIVEAQQAVAAKVGRDGGPLYGPIRDGATLIERPVDAVAAGAAGEIPVMIGTNRDEVKLFAATVRREEIDDGQLLRAVAATLPDAGAEGANRLIGTYRASRAEKSLPATNLDVLDAIQTDARFRANAMRLALAQRQHQPNTFLYLFTYESPARHGALGSCHALEMPFVFGTTTAPTQDRFAGTGPEVERLSANMMEAWLSFARTGMPGHEGIGPWPAYDDATRPTMVFDRESGLQEDPFADERRAIEALL